MARGMMSARLQCGTSPRGIQCEHQYRSRFSPPLFGCRRAATQTHFPAGTLAERGDSVPEASTEMEAAGVPAALELAAAGAPAALELAAPGLVASLESSTPASTPLPDWPA